MLNFLFIIKLSFILYKRPSLEPHSAQKCDCELASGQSKVPPVWIIRGRVLYNPAPKNVDVEKIINFNVHREIQKWRYISRMISMQSPNECDGDKWPKSFHELKVTVKYEHQSTISEKKYFTAGTDKNYSAQG